MRSNGTRKKINLSADDVDELIEMSEDEKVRRFWQTMKEEKLRGGISGNGTQKHKKFLSIPLYNNTIAVIFILALLSFSTWFLFNYTSISIPIDITRPALVVAFAFSAVMFHRYVSDKEEIVGMLDELAGYSVQNESIFENIGNALVVVDATGNVTKVNHNAEDILGASNSDLVGDNCQNVFPKYELADLLMKTLRSGKSHTNHEIELESSKGGVYHLQIITSPLKNKKGHTIGAVELINDVTEIHNLQEKLKLNEHLASVGELSAKLGHEVGNSLGGIKLFADNLLEELPDGDHRRGYAEEILSEVDRLKSKVSELKDYSRPVALQFKETDVNSVMDDVLIYTKNSIQENGITVRKNLDQELPNIMVDPDQVKGALLNVVINAIQAMPKGGELTVSTRRRNGTLEALVSDTGIGISDNNRKKIFNPFFTTKKVLGTGLGLSIVYKAVKAHGGTIKCDSKEGKGTTFTIGLPVVRGNGDGQAALDFSQEN